IEVLARRAATSALPFQPGLFLFPANLIDARDHKLRVYPLAELSRVSADPRGILVVAFGNRSFSFPVDTARVQELLGIVEAARDQMRKGPDDAQRRQLDPLEPPVVVSPLASTIPLSRRLSAWERRPWLLAAVVGTVWGAGLFSLRNMTSDDRMFAAARARN